MTEDIILSEYKEKYEVLKEYAVKLELYLKKILENYSRIDRITARAKSPDRYIAKATKLESNGTSKYSDPINQIQDQLGARIITYYLNDIGEVCKLIEGYFGPIESTKKQPETYDKFGYEGQHYILLWPEDVYIEDVSQKYHPKFFELQIKTLFQHAWSESNHDLGYKPEEELTGDQQRRIAFIAAQAWGADRLLKELFEECTNGNTKK